ncbi:Non-specific serine/threonine protein kinase [Bertholletia excelsa]
MWNRAMTPKARKSPREKKRDDESSRRTLSINDYEDCIFGFMDIDVPVIFCHSRYDQDLGQVDGGGDEGPLTLRGLLRGSVGMMLEGRMGMTEKAVLAEGRVYAVKRFRRVSVKRGEFGRRIQNLAHVSRRCQYLVPVVAYLYAKRIKFIVCDYYPMGSLSDLLSASRELGHTALGWNQRLMIILNVARAIAFIHSQSPYLDKRMQMNEHGNIKASSIMISEDFTARLSDYGFAQLAERLPPEPDNMYTDGLGQKSDIYNFGVVMLDLLGGPGAPGLRSCILEKKEEIKKEDCKFFEVPVAGKEKIQALQVLDIALACTTTTTNLRPSIENILKSLRCVLGYT